jgi:hypothetical protein
MYRNSLSLLLLAGVGIALLGGSLMEARGWTLYALAAIAIFFSLGLAAHFVNLRKNPRGAGAGKCIPIMATAVISVAATWGLSAKLGLNTAVASGLVGIVAALVLPGKLAVVAYTASFAGMSSLAVLTGLPMVICAGVLVGGIFILVYPVYDGIGGKLGTIAAGAVLTTLLVFRLLGGM